LPWKLPKDAKRSFFSNPFRIFVLAIFPSFAF
jgi:hypothetical protein